MKILLMTGTLAEPHIRKIAEEKATIHSIDVMVFPLAVAAFLHPKYIVNQLKFRKKLDKYDLILVPGLVLGDTTIITDSTEIPTFKGPRHAADLPILLEALAKETMQLSPTQPADLFIAERRSQAAIRELIKAEQLPPKDKIPPGTLRIGKRRTSVYAGPTFPMRIIAEITDAPLRSEMELENLTRWFQASGASIIDVGMVAESPDTKAAREIVKKIRKIVEMPVSIDSTNAREIIAGIKAGAQLILSIDKDSMRAIPTRLRKKAAFTVIPSAPSEGALPKTVEERIQLLEENIADAKKLGYKTIIADPLCDPLIVPGLAEAIQSYAIFSNKHPNIPLLMGVGNITELLDADSPGVNAILAGIASELDVTFLLTTEVSAKTKGSVFELHRAAQMMYLAKNRKSHPKDLGLDLLVLKSKQFPEETYDPHEEEGELVQAEAYIPISHKLDALGFFTIHLDRHQQRLIAKHYASPTTRTADYRFSGGSASQLMEAILANNLISDLGHAAYLGRELMKAEIALKTGRPYIQEAPLVPYWLPKPG